MIRLFLWFVCPVKTFINFSLKLIYFFIGLGALTLIIGKKWIMINFSICTYCKHFVSIKKSKKGHSYCSSFPDGIPNEIIHSSKSETHSKVVKGQVGTTIFECIGDDFAKEIIYRNK